LGRGLRFKAANGTNETFRDAESKKETPDSKRPGGNRRIGKGAMETTCIRCRPPRYLRVRGEETNRQTGLIPPTKRIEAAKTDVKH